jgi:hypothetical protein
LQLVLLLLLSCVAQEATLFITFFDEHRIYPKGEFSSCSSLLPVWHNMTCCPNLCEPY